MVLLVLLQRIVARHRLATVLANMMNIFKNASYLTLHSKSFSLVWMLLVCRTMATTPPL